MRRSLAVGLAALTLAAPASAGTLSRLFPSLFPPDDEELASMAAGVFEEVKRTEPLVTSGPAYDAVQRVGEAIRDASGRPDLAWEFILIDSPVANAWAMPGGKVAVYTGILPIVEDEAGLAAVMGHEVAHVLRRHTLERLEEMRGVAWAGLATNIATRNSSRRDEWMAAVGGISAVGIVLPYSRRQETEADEEGLLLMARSGYDPRAAPGVWDRMSAKGGRRPPEFLSTHPDPEDRAARLRDLLPTALEEYDRAPEKRPAEPIPYDGLRTGDGPDSLDGDDLRPRYRDEGADEGEGEFRIRIRF